ncbi:hypothetical protein PAJ_1074 [Pantoea ananatis AJ13355]|uniref:Uncharacterized protein n=1 Tax=Pantoea ananatis (strain AJ13355) TaxID=932677 RepID=A0A0H3KVB8_PANAA|nr:hypothetical protein PAJ_1074 [Pantoea ananatis AJ13355]
MQQKNSVWLEVAIDRGKVGWVVFRPHVFEHPHRDDAVKLLIQIAIILKQDSDIQPFAALLRQLLLFCRDRHALYADAIVSCCISRQTAPATANIQQGHTGFQLQLATDHVQFGFLCRLKRSGVFPVAAGVLHVRIEHQGKKVITQIIVRFADLPGPFFRLQVNQPGQRNAHDILHVMRKLLIKLMFQRPMKKHIQPLALPPAVHITFAQPQGALLQDAFKKIGMFNLNVPWAGTVDFDVCFLQ